MVSPHIGQRSVVSLTEGSLVFILDGPIQEFGCIVVKTVLENQFCSTSQSV